MVGGVTFNPRVRVHAKDNHMTLFLIVVKRKGKKKKKKLKHLIIPLKLILDDFDFSPLSLKLLI